MNASVSSAELGGSRLAQVASCGSKKGACEEGGGEGQYGYVPEEVEPAVDHEGGQGGSHADAVAIVRAGLWRVVHMYAVGEHGYGRDQCCGTEDSIVGEQFEVLVVGVLGADVSTVGVCPCVGGKAGSLSE